MDVNNKKSITLSIWHWICILGIILSTTLIPSIYYRVVHQSENHELFMHIIYFMLSFIIIVLFISQEEKFITHIEAIHNTLVFTIIYVFGVSFCILFSFLPVMSWAYLPLTILLLYASNEMTAFFSITTFLVITLSISDSSFMVMFVYMLSMMIALLSFRRAKNTTQYYLASVISLGFHLGLSFAYHVLFLESTLNQEVIFYVVINFLINFITLFFVIFFCDYFMVRKHANIYSVINDQEFVLIKQLKSDAEEKYVRAIHRAYFGEKIAPKIKVDSALIKTGIYYQHIDVLFDKEDLDKVLKENHFPMPARKLIYELQHVKELEFYSKELILVLIIDEILRMIEHVLQKDQKHNLDMQELISAISIDLFKRKFLEKSPLTFEDYNVIVSFFKEEKLYYDFLR